MERRYVAQTKRSDHCSQMGKYDRVSDTWVRPQVQETAKDEVAKGFGFASDWRWLYWI